MIDVSSVELVQAILIYVPGQQQQYLRPYLVDLQEDIKEKIMYDTNGGRDITPGSLINVASNILMPSPEPCGEVFIQNGFGVGRFAFYLQFKVVGLYHEEIEVLSGYTDYDGVSNTGHIDPNMGFNINNRSVLSRRETTSMFGSNTACQTKFTQNVLSSSPNFEKAFALGPEDAINNRQSIIHQYGGVEDTRTQLTGLSLLRDLKYNMASEYLSDVTNSYIKARDPSDDIMFENAQANMYAKARASVSNGSMFASDVYNAFRTSDFNKSHRITYGELNRIWPRDFNFWKVFPKVPGAIRNPLEYSSHWGGADMGTHIASILSHVIPSIMAKNGVEKLEVSISNLCTGGRVFVVISGITTLFKESMSEQLIRFITQEIEMHIVKSVLMQKVNVFDIFASVCLRTQCSFEIGINEGFKTPYVCPNFSNSSNSPMFGPEKQYIDDIGEKIEMLADTLYGQANSRSLVPSSTSVTLSSMFDDTNQNLQENMFAGSTSVYNGVQERVANNNVGVLSKSMFD